MKLDHVHGKKARSAVFSHSCAGVEMIEIYGLLDPRDGKLRYIGKANSSQQRLSRHLSDVKRRNTPVYKWIREVLHLGLRPTIQVLEICEPALWKIRERAWIRGAREMGGVLLNVADGGDEPACPSHVRAANARKAINSRASTPRKAYIYKLKKTIGQNIAAGFHSSEESKARLRLAAQLAPHLFGEWASL